MNKRPDTDQLSPDNSIFLPAASVEWQTRQVVNKDGVSHIYCDSHGHIVPLSSFTPLDNELHSQTVGLGDDMRKMFLRRYPRNCDSCMERARYLAKPAKIILVEQDQERKRLVLTEDDLIDEDEIIQLKLTGDDMEATTGPEIDRIIEELVAEEVAKEEAAARRSKM